VCLNCDVRKSVRLRLSGKWPECVSLTPNAGELIGATTARCVRREFQAPAIGYGLLTPL